jgi:hypothetical protein
MKANTCNLNIRPRPTPASSGSLMNAHFDLVSLLLAEWQFQDLREYMSLAQNFVVRQQRDFQKRVDDYTAVNALEGEDKDQYYSSLEDDQDQLHSRFPHIVFSSTLLMACALFESSLVDMCKAFERVLPTPIPWSRGKNNGITKAAAFLKENYGVCLSNYSHWERVMGYFKVRDCIVHAGGDISNMKPEQANRIRKAVELYGSLGLCMTNRHLGIGQEFVSAVIDDLGGIWPLLGTC